MLCAVNSTPSFVFSWSWMPPTRFSLSLFSLEASCQQDHRGSLGKVDQGGSEVQIAGFQHHQLGSNVAFLGEGVVEVAAKEDEGTWGCESKDKRLEKERTKLRNVLVFGFLQGTVEELPLPVPAGSNHCGKSLPCTLECLCGPGIHEAGFFFQHGFATCRIHRRAGICSVGSPEQLCGTTLHHQWGGF